MSRRIISLVLSFGLLFQQVSFAQVAAELNIANYLSKIGSNLVQDKFRPLHLRYFSYDSLNDNFKVLLDKGDLKNLKTPELENSTKTLLSYFLVGVALPDDMFWVNLRPDSQDQIIDPYLEKTDIGKIMLEADLQLKKDTALFTSPQAPEGREYWNRFYKKAAEIFGNENITIPTLTRPWIVPGEIIVREAKDSAYVYKASLKVMLEQDYLKDSATYNFKDERSKTLNKYSSQLIRELIIPKLTKEVNSSKRYAALRQVYYSLILSRWFKLRFTGKTGTYASLINTQNLTNLISKESWSKTDYFKQYQKSFQDGEYNIKEPVYTPTGQTIRSYFSGGINIASSAINTQNGIILSNDNAKKLGDVIGGRAVVDPRSLSLKPAAVSSPIKNSGEELPSSAVDINAEMYKEQLRPILQDKNKNVLDEIKRLNEEGKLSQIFPVMEVLKGKPKYVTKVFEHTLRVIEELELIKKGDMDGFNSRIEEWRKAWPKDWNFTWTFQGEEGTALFNKYCQIFQDVTETPEDRELLYIIALLHDVGEQVKTQGHPKESARMTELWLKQLGFREEQINKAKSVIRSHVDLGALYFAERTPDYLSSNPESLNIDLKSQEEQGYIKTLSLLTFVDTGEAIVGKKAEFYAEVGNNPKYLEELINNFYERRWKLFSSKADENIDDSKNVKVNEELKKLEELLSKEKMAKFKETINRGIQVIDYCIFFCRGLKGDSLVKMLFIIHKLIEGKPTNWDKITRVNLTAPSGVAPIVAAMIDKNILGKWDLKDITNLSPEDLINELEKKGLSVRYKDGQLFIYNWEYYNASLKLKELRQNSGLPFAVEPSNVPVEPSKNLFWSGLLCALHFDSPVYRRVERIGTVKESDFSKAGIFESLRDNGYIDKKGEIQPKFAKLDNYQNMSIDPAYGSFRKQIYDILKSHMEERYTGQPAYANANEGVDKNIKDLMVYDVSIPEFYSIREGENVRGFILESDAPIPPKAYFMHRGVFASREDIRKAFYDNKIRFDITVVPPAIWGVDFAKKVGHYHDPIDKPEIYQVVSGEVLWLMQKTDEKGNVVDFIAVKAKAGDIAIMLPGYGHVSVNLSETEPLVMADWLTWHQSSYYGSFKDKKGAAYYVIKNNQGKPELRSNPEYQKTQKVLPLPRQRVSKDEIPAFGLIKGIPIYNLVKLDDKEFSQKVRFLYYPEEFANLLTPEATLNDVKPEGRLEVSTSSPLNKEALEYLETLERSHGEVSISSIQSLSEKNTGGIDFRALPITIQAMGSFSGLNFKLPQLTKAELAQININSEMQQIKNMVQSGITPSGQRIKELVAACVQKKEMASQANSLLLCLADVFKLEEENASASSPELMEALVIVDSQS